MMYITKKLDLIGEHLAKAHNLCTTEKVLDEIQAAFVEVNEMRGMDKDGVQIPYYKLHDEIESLRAQLAEANARTVMEFSGDEIPTFSQGLDGMDLLEVVTAERCTSLVGMIKDLRAQLAAAKPDVDAMVNRFLGWKLPLDFAPDCGISFKREDDYPYAGVSPQIYGPIGTNLFTADQAKAMIEYMLAAPLPEDE